MKRKVGLIKHDAYYPWLFLVAFIMVWQLAVQFFKIPKYVLPTPIAILSKGFEIRAVLGHHILVTLMETLVGFVTGAIVGGIAAFLIDYYPLVRKIFLPYMVAFQTMPKLGLAPLFIIWLGFGFLTNIAIVTSLSFFPVLVNFFAGLDQFDEDEERLMASYNASKNQVYFHVRFFRALPFLFTGLELGIILSVTGSIVAEFIAGNEGLGYLAILANNTLDTPMMFCALLLLGILGFGVFHGMSFLKTVLMPWSKKTETLTSVEGSL
jgi:NitT/TauT family transport system permease protein